MELKIEKKTHFKQRKITCHRNIIKGHEKTILESGNQDYNIL